jgi:dTDP-4-amino-4,6-dideoxygalactose transaminase
LLPWASKPDFAKPPVTGRGRLVLDGTGVKAKILGTHGKHGKINKMLWPEADPDHRRPGFYRINPGPEAGGYGREGSFPETERVSKEILSLPMYPEMTDDQLDTICALIRDFDKI